MRIIVCVKQIGFVYYPTPIDLSTGEIDSEKMISMLNPYDEVAVEEAIKIKENLIDCKVMIITSGQPETESALRYAFAMGGDRMIRINYESPDPWSTSLVLAAAIEKIGYDLVLCGKKAIDSNGNQVGSFIAEILGIPQVSGIVRLNLFANGRKATVEKYLGKGDKEEIECNLPALFTVDMKLNVPRYPKLRNRLLAERGEVEEIDPIALGIDLNPELNLTRIVKFTPPRPKTRKMFTPSTNLSPEDRIRLTMGRGVKNKEGHDILEGSPDQLAGYILQFLIQNKLLVEQGKNE